MERYLINDTKITIKSFLSGAKTNLFLHVQTVQTQTGAGQAVQARLSYLRSTKSSVSSFAAIGTTIGHTHTHNAQARTRQASGRSLECCESMYLMFEQRQVFVLTHPQASPVRSSLQQRRNLSIHEYLSANLLRSVRLLLWLSSTWNLKNL